MRGFGRPGRSPGHTAAALRRPGRSGSIPPMPRDLREPNREVRRHMTQDKRVDFGKAIRPVPACPEVPDTSVSAGLEGWARMHRERIERIRTDGGSPEVSPNFAGVNLSQQSRHSTPSIRIHRQESMMSAQTPLRRAGATPGPFQGATELAL
jgi:hypothetical protein